MCMKAFMLVTRINCLVRGSCGVVRDVRTFVLNHSLGDCRMGGSPINTYFIYYLGPHVRPYRIPLIKTRPCFKRHPVGQNKIKNFRLMMPCSVAFVQCPTSCKHGDCLPLFGAISRVVITLIMTCPAIVTKKENAIALQLKKVAHSNTEQTRRKVTTIIGHAL